MRDQSPNPSFRPGAMRPASPSRRRAALGLAAAVVLPALPACASERQVDRHPVALSIVDRETGQALATHRHEGRTYVAGRPAARYAIRLANHSAGRVLVVLSVDGVNVVSGETAAASQTGYVLDPWQTTDITGWRKSETAVAAFVFAAVSNSYAARTGRPDNVGVIGAAVFLEKAVPVAEAADAGIPRAAAPAAPAALGATPSLARKAAETAQAERLGTRHGEREWSVSRRTSFERLSPSPQDLLQIVYDSRENLVQAGIIPVPTAQARAFPGGDGRGFVPDPPCWR